MTIEEKITRYRGIPKLIKDLQIDKEICTSVKSVQFDSIGEAKGTHGNSTEKKLIDAAEISEKIAALQQERDLLTPYYAALTLHSVDLRQVCNELRQKAGLPELEEMQ